MEKKLRIAMFGQKRLSREGGIEIVVRKVGNRMAAKGHRVTCYNRSGHHVSGAEYDHTDTACAGVRQKSVLSLRVSAISHAAIISLRRLSLAVPVISCIFAGWRKIHAAAIVVSLT